MAMSPVNVERMAEKMSCIWYRLTVVPPPRLSRQRFDLLTEGARQLLRYSVIEK